MVDEDAGLTAVLSGSRLAQARRASTAGVLKLAAGQWDASGDVKGPHRGYGLLALDGLLVRQVAIAGRVCADLLGEGDLLRPWQPDEGQQVPFEHVTCWRVVAPARLAVLDSEWAMRMAAFPAVGTELSRRPQARASRQLRLMTIAQQRRLDVRIWLVFRELADRFGCVHPDGIHLELPLTHELLGQLALARRPSVSSALATLADRGVIRRQGRVWVIAGPPEDPRSLPR